MLKDLILYFWNLSKGLIKRNNISLTELQQFFLYFLDFIGVVQGFWAQKTLFK